MDWKIESKDHSSKTQLKIVANWLCLHIMSTLTHFKKKLYEVETEDNV